MTKKVAVLGAGPMAGEYAKIARELGWEAVVIGRGEASGARFKETFGYAPLLGGIAANREALKGCEKAIVATSEDTLDSVTTELIAAGLKSILVEKPGSKDLPSLLTLQTTARKAEASVFVGYNRRFYQSVRGLKERIQQDGGLKSMVFEFTEWGHVIEGITKYPGVKENWLWHNSSHVIDLAFDVGGVPAEMTTFKKGSLSWHPEGEVFVGAGLTTQGVPFSYHANWGGPGRWWLEFVTANNRYVLKPVEKLQVQPKGTVRIDMVELDYGLDEKFKPGLYLQTDAFMNNSGKGIPTLDQQVEKIAIYQKILGH